MDPLISRKAILSCLLLRENGVSRREIIQVISIKEWEFTALITDLARTIENIGLQIRYNPITRTWHAVKNSKISEELGESSIPDRMAATLFFLLKYRYSESRFPTIQELVHLRQISEKSIRKDLKDLDREGLIQIIDNIIFFGEKIALYLPLNSQIQTI